MNTTSNAPRRTALRRTAAGLAGVAALGAGFVG